MSRNYKKENEIINILESYRAQLPKEKQAWDKIAKEGKFGRKAIYKITNSQESVRRETVISLGKVLRMNIQDFCIVYEFAGYSLRPFNERESAVIKQFESFDRPLSA